MTLRARQPGQVIGLAAVLMVALLGMMAFVVDAGIFLTVRRELSNAADAAALAGASKLSPEVLPATANCADVDASSSLAFQVACEYAETNVAPIASRLCATAPTFEVANGALPLGGGEVYTLTVTPSCQAGYSIGRVLGLLNMPVAASATAALGSAKESDCPLPFGADPDLTPDDPDTTGYEYGVLVELKVADGSGGNWHMVDVTSLGGGANELREWLEQPCGAALDGAPTEIGDQVYTEPGGMVGPIRQGLQDRGLVSCTGAGAPAWCQANQPAGYGNHPAYKLACPHWYEDVTDIGDDGEPWVSQPSFCFGVVPVVSISIDAVNGRELMEVDRWALFLIEGLSEATGKDGIKQSVWGRFVKGTIISDIAEFDPEGVLVLRLIR